MSATTVHMAWSHLGHTDKLPHKIRLFPLQFRKLVNDDKKMGNRLPGLSVLIQSGIGVNVVYTVPGTTGSGKSETLQTYILSLALNFSPDDIGLFIIDYKGGGMGNLFSALPHTLGQISNLSGNQVQRAMVSGMRHPACEAYPCCPGCPALSGRV